MAKAEKKPVEAAAIIRVATGLAFLYFGAQMLFGAFGGRGFEATAGRIQADLGFAPGTFFAVLIGGGILLCGFLLFIGLFTRIVWAPVAITAGLALFWEQWETLVYQEPVPFPTGLVFFAAASAIYFLGAGAYSIDRKLARERAEASA